MTHAEYRLQAMHIGDGFTTLKDLMKDTQFVGLIQGSL
jgi:hypothetical protein